MVVSGWRVDDALRLRRAIVVRAVWLLCVLVGSGCSRAAPQPPPLVSQVSGSIEVDGVSAPVRVVRDRWGVPHIYAQTEGDLFVAQGFVQAQDRLFQMDLWRHAAQGRLSQVLGANFIERDAMTRRMRYRGNLDVEWASYGSDVKAIAAAFARGINAWVALARERPPEEFVLARWKPEFWSAADVLTRTDAFLESEDALDEIRRRNVHEVVAEAIRRVGTAPFFVGASAPDDQTRVRSASASEVGSGALHVSDAPRRLEHPSRRYVVHLTGAGWNVIGATSPWLPGVAAGHNDRIAFGGVASGADTQDIFIENAAVPRTLTGEAFMVKGRSTPFVFDSEMTRHGIVVASDREHDLLYTLRWSGFEPGAAAELGALAVDRARTWIEFRAALARWKMPARRMQYADVEGNAGFQDAGLVPVRRAGEWNGWMTLDQLPHALNPRSAPTAVGEPPRGRSVAANALFAHPLAMAGASRQRFNIGPLPRPAGDDSPVRLVLDPRDWDRSRAMNAPGQSGSPASAHCADLAKIWSVGGDIPLAFTDAAVQANAEATLMLLPRGAISRSP